MTLQQRVGTRPKGISGMHGPISLMRHAQAKAGIGCESWQVRRVGSREIRVTEDAEAAQLVGQAVVADKWCRSGKQRAVLQGLDEGRDEDVMNAIRKQIAAMCTVGCWG